MRGQTFHHIADGDGAGLARWLNLGPSSRWADWVVLELVELELELVVLSFWCVDLGEKVESFRISNLSFNNYY